MGDDQAKADSANAAGSESTKPQFLTILITVLAAAVGVQNKKNLERDFSQSSPLPFIVAGVLFTVFFVVALITLVSFIV